MLLFSGVATVINAIKNPAESVRGRGGDAATQHFTTQFMYVDSFFFLGWGGGDHGCTWAVAACVLRSRGLC